MIRKLTKAILLSLLAIMLVVPSVVLAYTYYANYIVTEANGTDYDMLAVLETSNNDWMATNGFMDADALDTTIETLGGLVKPHMVADDKTLTAIPVPADSQTNLIFTTGNDPPATEMDIIAGYDGYVTILDHANLELDDEFIIDTKGFVDTTATGDVDILYKTDAFRLFVSAADDITAAMLGSGSEILRPDGHNTCVIPWEAGAACNLHWQNVDEVVADDAATYVRSANDNNTFIDYYTLSNPAALPGGAFNIVANLTIRGVSSGAAWYRGDLQLGADITTGTQRTSGGYATFSEDLARPGGGAWQVADFAGLLVGVAVYTDGASVTNVTQVFLTISWEVPISEVTATPITSQIVRIVVEADTVNLDIDVFDDDGNLLDNDTIALAGASVPDNGNDYILMSNVIPYTEYYSHTTAVGGVSEKINYEPDDMVVATAFSGAADAGSDADTIIDAELTQVDNYWIGALVTITEAGGVAPEGETSVCTAFADATDEVTVTPAFTAAVGAGDSYTIDFGTLVNENNPGTYDGRITWGVNPTGVAVAIGSMVSTSQPLVGGDEETPTTDVLPEAEVSDWFVVPDVTGTLLTNPLRPFVTMLSDNTQLTELQAWRLLALAVILFVTVATAVAVKRHLAIAGIASASTIGGAVALTIFPLWAVVFAIGALAGGLIAERSPSL